MRLLRNVFATSNPDQSAVEIVTKHIDPNGNYAQIVLDANSADNDAFWCGSDPNCADDPNNCDSNCNLLWVHDYGTTGASYRKADMLAGLSYTAIIEYSGNVKKSIPVYSPPADFNLDGVVDHVDFLAWQAGYPRSTGGTKRNGDANRDGKVDGCDFDIWQSAFPWTPADFNSDSHVDGNDFFIWRAHYPTASGATHAMGDADGDGVVDYTDFLIWHQAIGLDYSPPADFNDDCKVDGVDFLVWQSHYPTNSGATKAQGDANGDGKVDGVDYLIWQNWYGQGGWPPAAPGDDNDNMVAGQNLHPTLIDYNGDGVITPDEVSRLFSSLGEDQ
jgi:hypothetical protein